MSSAESSYQGIQVHLDDLRALLTDARARYTQLTKNLASSPSAIWLADRVDFLMALAKRQTELAEESQLELALGREMAAQSNLLAEQAAAVRTLDDQRQALDQRFAAQQSALASLATTRGAVQARIKKLRHQLSSKEFAAASRCFGFGMPISYGRWAEKFLPAIAAPASRNNLVVMVAWQAAEGTMASWNPLATTYSMPGATSFNSIGVKNYRSLTQGIRAIALTLQTTGYGYEFVIADLQASSDPMVTATAINASYWCHGCAAGQYVIQLVPAVEQYFAEFSSR
jgi:hypothetical protein